MKAYRVYDEEGYSELVAAETRDKAKSIAFRWGDVFSGYDRSEYVHVRAKREPAADAYIKERSVSGLIDFEKHPDLFDALGCVFADEDGNLFTASGKAVE